MVNNSIAGFERNTNISQFTTNPILFWRMAKILNNFVRKDKDIIVSLSNFTLKYKLNLKTLLWL
jgi:hypothetical protein